MRRSFAVLVLASIVATAASGLVSVSLGLAQAMNGNVVFMQSSGHHMNYESYHDCNEDTSAYLNATHHIHGNMHGKYDGLHTRTDMTRHMGGMN